MWLTDIAIRLPMVVLIAIGAIIAFGLVSYTRLGVELLPALDAPVVTVTTPYPGAGPEAVDILVTRKIEDAVASLNEIDTIQSMSNEGVSTVTVTFMERAAKTIAQDVERRVNSVRAELPDESKPPIVEKFDPNAQPIMQLSLGASRNADSESEQTLAGLQRLAEDNLKKDLEAISGVARVTVIGGLEREIQVQVDQQKLQAHGVSILQVTQALAADNLNVPAGSVTQRNQDWTIRLTSQAQTLADLQSILVASNPGGSVRVRDVAVVLDTYKKVSVIQRTDGVASVGVLVYKQASANTVATAEAVSKQLVPTRTKLPPGVSITVPQDSSIFVKSSVADVQVQLGLAVLLTGLVLLVFLHTFRSTAIVLLTIPTSLVATFGVMSILGLTFNFMSLMGLALTVGILVDDSIVVLENIGRHLNLGEPPREAAMNGRSEIGMAAIAITLVDVVVFTPIAFMTGAVGQYFREFGLVIASATLFSLAVSFTLTPLLASRWYRLGQGGGASHKAGSRHPLAAFARIWDAGFARLQVGYGRGLRTSLRYRWGVVLLAIASFIGGLALVLFGVLSTEFLPQDDAGFVLIGLEMPAGTTLATTSAATSKVEDRLLAVPPTESVFTSVGVGSDFSAAGQSRFATIYVRLVDKQHRQRSVRAVAEQIRSFGSDVPGMTLKSSPLSTFGGGGGGAIQVHIQGEDQQVLATLAGRVAEIVRNVQGTVDIRDGGVIGQPELVVSIDRERAADVGLSAGQVASVLRTGLAGSIVGTFRPAGTKGWDVNVILNPQDRARVDQVVDIPVITPQGSTIRVGQVAQVSRVSGPTQVSRNRDRSVTVTADVNGRASGDVSRDIQAGLDRLVIPPGYKVGQGGDAENQNEAFLQIFQALGLSVVLMYLLMAVLFESLLFPLIVMLSLPLALVGAFGLLALTGNTLNLMSMIGMILLTGLVGKNAILMVDYTNHLRQQGEARESALLLAGPIRLRPILMTTCALILAMLPLAFKLGEGGEWRSPLAVTVIGGLVTSTFLTLLVVPAVYTIVDDAQRLASNLPRRIRKLSQRWLRSGRHPPIIPVPVAGATD